MPTLLSPIDAAFTPLSWDQFGVIRPLNIDPSGQPHTGVDLRPHENGGSRNVYAAADGVIIVNTPNLGSYYCIDHSGNMQTLYVHMANRPLKVGTKVKKGDILGQYSLEANHLHFMVRVNGQDKNPEDFINFEKLGKEEPTNQPPMTEEMITHIINTARNYYDLSDSSMEFGLDFAKLEKLIVAQHPDQAFALILDTLRGKEKDRKALATERSNLWSQIETLKSKK